MPGEPLRGRAGSVDESRVDGCRTARPTPRATFARSSLRGPNREPFLHDAASEPPSRLVVGQGEDGARMALAHVTASEHPQHLFREARAGAGGSTPPASSGRPGRPRLRATARTRPRGMRTRAPPRRGRAARARRSRRARAGASRCPRRRGRAQEASRRRPTGRRASGARPRRARSRLPLGAVDDDRLQDALEPDRAREAGGRLRLEPAARLPRIRVDGLDRQMDELGLARLPEQDFEAAAEAAPLLRNARQAPSPPSSRPRRRRSGGRRRSRELRGSAPPRGAPSAGWSS